MSHAESTHDSDDVTRGGNGSHGTSGTGGVLTTTVDTQLPALPAAGWSYGPPQKPEILSAKANPVELLHAVRRRWPLAIGLGLLVGTVAAGLVYWLVPVKYEVYALLRVAPKRSTGVLEKSSEAYEEYSTFKRTQVQLILSPVVLRRTVGEPDINKLSLIQEHNDDPFSWLKGQLILDYPDDSEILRVALKGKKHPELKKIVDTVVKKYLSEIVQHERELRFQHEASLQARYEQYQKDLGKQAEALHQMEVVAKSDTTEAARITKKLALDSIQEALSLRNKISLERNEVDSDLAIAEAKENSKEDTVATEFAIDMELNKDPLVFTITQRLAELHEFLAQERHRAANPGTSKRVRALQYKIQELTEKLDETKANLRPKLIEMKAAEEEKKNEKTENLKTVPLLKAKKEQLEKQFDALEKRIAEEADVFDKFENFSASVQGKQDEVRALKEITNQLRAEVERAKVERLAMERISKVDEATLDSPTGDAMRKYVGVGFSFLLGFFGVVLGIAFMEFQRRRINGVDQVNDGLGIKVIGELPNVSGRTWRRIKGGKGAAVLKALMAERIDGTRTAIIHSAAVDPPRVVMVSSALPHEGKTTTATQLAASLARSGRRTVLVDADIRNPGDHRVFDMPLEPGLCELLRGEAERDAAVHPTRTPNLWLLPAGRCDLKSVQALSGAFLGSAIAGLCVQFDYVIIDAGPVLKVADALMVGQHVDGAILSVLRDTSQVPKVYEACERLRSVGINVLGSVVNGVKDDAARHGVELLMAETS